MQSLTIANNQGRNNMLSLDQIVEHSRQAAARAARIHAVPFRVEAEDLQDWTARLNNDGRVRFPFPFLGPHIPKGWHRTGNEFFVDSSGLGSDGEPALTIRAFVKKLRPGYAYAVIEAGEFQLYVAEFTDKTNGN
jgi:hypothetical protein